MSEENKDSAKAEARIMKKISKEEIEKQKGSYDADGFYILEGKDFFDPNGYYFDKEGFDASGGRYDD